MRGYVTSTTLSILFVLSILASTSAQAQTFTVLQSFTGGPDGDSPSPGLKLDRAGNLYGTTDLGGAGYGTVFKMTHKSGGWLFIRLYSFGGQSDGIKPRAIIIGPNGGLYDTTQVGGAGGVGCGFYGCGTVFSLAPPPHAPPNILGGWRKTTLHLFTGIPDGANPNGDLVFDQAGNIYGTTIQAGMYNWGTVYELTPDSGGLTESVLYAFSGNNDAANPTSGVVLDKAGNLYGTAFGGSYGSGTVYQLTPSPSGWGEHIIYTFQNGSDGFGPVGVIFDQSGNLYGTTYSGGSGNGGTVFELIPSNGGWTFNLLYSLTSQGGSGNPGPHARLVMDAGGSLYGTTYYEGAYGHGSVFKLTPSNGGWGFTPTFTISP
jgi:uncharacterized repeat protein (TIGR03803 family)